MSFSLQRKNMLVTKEQVTVEQEGRSLRKKLVDDET
jgi:hypothetical protein